MTKFKSRNYSQSVNHALKGLRLAIYSQRNFKLEATIAIIVFVAAELLKFSITDMAILILTIAFVLVAELLNSIIEFTLDAVYKNNYSKLVEMAKDMAAGMVFFSVFMSSIIGIFLFVPYLMDVFY